MDIQQLAPWASLAASVLTLVYVGVQEWRRYPQAADTPNSRNNRPSLGELVSGATLFLLVTVSMLFLAGLAHYLLLFTPATVLIVPVWLLALFVIVSVGLIETMPGETFEEKVEEFTDQFGADVDVDIDGSPSDREERSAGADE